MGCVHTLLPLYVYATGISVDMTPNVVCHVAVLQMMSRDRRIRVSVLVSMSTVCCTLKTLYTGWNIKIYVYLVVCKEEMRLFSV